MFLSSRRLRPHLPWLLVAVLIVAGVLSLVKMRSYLRSTPSTATATPRPRSSTAGTRSMADVRLLGAAAPLAEHLLFFNRVPKSGGEMLVLLLQWLQGVNGFRHVRLGGGDNRRLEQSEQEALAEEVSKKTREQAVPVSFDRHVYFLNFTKFGRQSPLFLNIVRDPIDKALSRYYYRRVTPNPRSVDPAPSRPTLHFRTSTFEECVDSGDVECTFEDGVAYDLAIPYFCGHEHWCMFLNNRRALNRAKENVERFYPVVGILEEMNATLAVLEKRLSFFFSGVQDMYYNELQEPHKNKNRRRPRAVSASVRTHLTARLRTEYEFYNWLYARLVRQYVEKDS